MPNCFVEPDTVSVALSNGHTVELKKRLTYAEQRRLAGGALRYVLDANGEQRTIVDLEYAGIERLFTWIASWDFEDAQGNPVAVSRSAIAHLDAPLGAEIERRLDAHIESVNALSAPESAEEAIAQHRREIGFHESAIAEIENAKNVRKPG